MDGGCHVTLLSSWRTAGLLVASILLSACYVATHYNAWQYRGGQLVDNGIFSHPRYEARFGEVRFDVPGTYSHSFSQFPGSDAVVMLATPSGPSDGSIENLATQLRVRVVDQNGRLLCEGSGSPGGTGDHQFVVTSSGQALGLWHSSCARLQLRSCNPCQLHLSVGPVDPATPNILLVPTVQGGGIELP